MHHHTLAELAALLEKKEISSVELTSHYLNRIKQFNPTLNCYITVSKEQALEQAKHADARRAKGEHHLLTGIPIAQKDILCTKGIKTTCASKMLENFTPPFDASCVKSFNDAGCIMIGKLNMDEFAMGSSNENSYFGACRNPWDSERVPGGSSGGSAAAVAARLAPGTTGTDTGGSIRQPASLCGLTGLKPTYGRVSRYGLIAYASSLDQAGPMAVSAEDNALMLNLMAGPDPKDSTCSQESTPDYTATLNDSLEGVKIGVAKELLDGLDENICNKIHDACKEFEKMGATIIDVEFSHNDIVIPVYYIIASAECSSNLARFDGVRYTHRAENPSDLEDMYRRTRSEAFGSEVKHRIIAGTYALSSGYYDAFYLKAQKARRLLSNDYQEVFKKVDVMLTPTSPTTAFKIGEKIADPVSMYLSDIYTVAVNLAGLPALSMPGGFHDNLPVGLQLIGNHFSEAKLLNVAHQYQQVTDWHKQIPDEFK